MSNLKKIDDAWLNIDVDESKIFNPLTHTYANSEEEFHIHLTWLMSQPEYFSFVCKQVFNIDILPMQSLILHELWNRKFPMLIGSRGLGKSFILSLYSMLRAFFMPGRKIVIVGAAFRQSKVIFEYMDTIWRNAPILQSICSDSSGPRRDVDRCTMRVNDSWAMAVPLGDGSKIRGLRAHTIIADEFNSIPTHIYETVVAGFAAVSSNPTQNVKDAAKRKKMQGKGTWVDKMEEQYSERKTNQSIIAGTAGYAFEPYASYWKKYKETIQSHGDFKKVAEKMGDDPEEVPEADEGRPACS